MNLFEGESVEVMPLNPYEGVDTLYSYFGTDNGQSFRTGSARDLIRSIRDGD